MEADFSTFELQYQTAVIRNARFCQDASLEPWDNEPEELLPTTVAELQRIAAFSPHGGLSYESAWEYLFLYNTYYVLDAPYENAPELCQLVLTYDAAFVVRYLSTIRLPLHRLRAGALIQRVTRILASCVGCPTDSGGLQRSVSCPLYGWRCADHTVRKQELFVSGR